MVDEKSNKLLRTVILSALAFSLCGTVLSNLSGAAVLVPLSLLLLISFCFRNFFNKKSRLLKILGGVSFSLDMALVCIISILDPTEFSQVFYYVLIMDGIMHYAFVPSLIFSMITYLLYVFANLARYLRWNYFDLSYFFPALYKNLVYFIFVFIAAYVAKHQFAQKLVLSETAEKLREKSLQLESANSELRKTMLSLEEMTLLKERNRIASEIHDTTGHTLTTVLIEIEAGKRLVGRDPSLACEKLELAQEQVRKGLNDVRDSVRMLNEGGGLLGFIPSVASLINETRKHTGVTIDYELNFLPELSSEQQKLLYRALQEGLTNGIRHGSCTGFVFKLKCVDDRILFILRDNARGCENMNYGFGLSAMKHRIGELGGTMEINTSAGKGFKLAIQIPVDKECLHDANKDTCCG